MTSDSILADWEKFETFRVAKRQKAEVIFFGQLLEPSGRL
jgi:hypothetical protein